jgi:hypothetical protein
MVVTTRLQAMVLLSAGLLGTGCGSGAGRFVAPPGTTLGYSVQGQSESTVCPSPVTRESNCTVTLTARVELGELEGRELRLRSLRTVVRDARTGQDLGATPGELTAEDIRRVAGSNVVAAHGHLTIPLTLQFQVGAAPFYVDGPHELQVALVMGAP